MDSFVAMDSVGRAGLCVGLFGDMKSFKRMFAILTWLVVWLPFLAFSQKYWVAIIIPIDGHIFQRG